jgi:hypothetical protein
MEAGAVQQLQAAAPPEVAPAVWSLPKRVLFRFVFCYFGLYSMPEMGPIADSIPGGAFVTKWYVNMWHAIVPWIATRVFHVTGQAATYFPTGSGDTTLMRLNSTGFHWINEFPVNR